MKSFAEYLLGSLVLSTPILAIPTAARDTVTHPVFRSRDWVGAALINIAPNENYTTAECHFKIPQVKVPKFIPAEQSGEWHMATACGLDGDLNQNAFVNTGVHAIITRDDHGVETTTYTAGATWFPAPEVPFQIEVHPGDQVSASVVALSTTTARCTCINWSTGKSGQLTIQAAGPDNALDGSSADFVVIRVESDSDKGELFDLADWDTVEITNINAKTQLHDYDLNSAPHSNIINLVDPTTLSPIANATDPSATTMKATFVQTS